MRPRSYHVLPIYSASLEGLNLPDKERRQFMSQLVKSAGEEGFPANHLSTAAEMAPMEELTVIAAMLLWMGGPLVWSLGSVVALVVGDWRVRAGTVLLALALALHPMPSAKWRAALPTSWFTRALYRYFSYRFVWCDDDMEESQKAVPWIGAGPPHGVLPFANVLSIPAINTCAFVPFVGAPASVVFRVPFLRYMTLFACVPVDKKSIIKTISRGTCVGIVPDGVAGIFHTHRRDEVVALKKKKGLARLALATGTTVLPAYSFGNTAAFSCWYDRFGVLEFVSRKLQASLFLYWGRWGLPIPRRTQITMVIGRPIRVDKVDNPTQEQVDELHERILAAIQANFDRHKDALGWGHKRLIFE